LREHHLILGGCGFIGRHVALQLARAGHAVVQADRVPPAYAFPKDAAPLISFQALEFASADWDSFIANASVIHHYAWTSIPASANANPLGDLTSNVSATLSLLEALRRRGGGRVIFSSSGGTVYGKLDHVPVRETHPLKPITAYGAGKAAAELYLNLYRSLYGLDCRIARIANPFGVGQNLSRGQGAASTFLHAALLNQPIVIWGDGEVVRDYVHVTDVASALVSLALVPELDAANAFNIGSGLGVSLNQIVTELEHRLARKLNVTRQPGRPFDVPVSVLDVGLACKLLRWKPSLSFGQGMALTMDDLAAGAVISTYSPSAGTDAPAAR
jgi:UDP-glucose 4-epimerase